MLGHDEGAFSWQKRGALRLDKKSSPKLSPPPASTLANKRCGNSFEITCSFSLPY